MKNTILETNLDGLDILLRYPKSGDAKSMCDYINILSKEKTYITWQGEKLKLKDEEKYLNDQLERIKNKETVQLLIFVNNKLSGISSIDLGKRIQSHIGNFGISIAKEFRGKGLGKLLMKNVLDQATTNIRDLKIITLEVFAENKRAMSIYENFGFKKYGKLPD
ncbi:MAG: GNAT family N-acetyltransferase, partial [Patescibacteria group bacterium]